MKPEKGQTQNDRIHNDILAYVDQHGVMNKDRLAASTQKPRKVVSPKKSRAKTVRAVLELHGMTSEPAAAKCKLTIDRCRERGIKELLIIHGKGTHSNPQEGPVLKNLVRSMLEGECSNVIRHYRTAAWNDGGEGATVVYLRL